MKIEFVAQQARAGEGAAEAIFAFTGASPLLPGRALHELSSIIGKTLNARRFKGAIGESVSIVAPRPRGFVQIIVVGAGPKDEWNASNAELAAAHAYNAAKSNGAESLILRLPESTPLTAAHAALGARLASYRFDKYRTQAESDSKPSIKVLQIATQGAKAAEREFGKLAGLADAICFARDLVSEPANVLYPAEFARRLQPLVKLGLKIEVLGEKEMKRLGMGALLGVGQGSARESQLAILRWNGAKSRATAPIAFVGKGVCFDAGGISLKPADRMEEMIIDMAGAAAVTGAMYALAARKAKVNAVGILGLVENMPDGAAQRPGDVVTSMSGQTVEIINTDAEGRLVLADALWYCQQRFKPKIMVDLATLTGAAIVALGTDIGALFSNNDALANNLLGAAATSGDALWRLPLPAQYEKALESRVADVKHVGDRFAGAITAALFIRRFVNNVPWAHLDIGMTVWKPKSIVPTAPDGATGYGVRLLNSLVAEFYEEK